VIEYQSKFIESLGAKISLDVLELFHYMPLSLTIENLETWFEQTLNTALNLKDEGITASGIKIFKEYLMPHFKQCKFYCKTLQTDKNTQEIPSTIVISLCFNDISAPKFFYVRCTLVQMEL